MGRRGRGRFELGIVGLREKGGIEGIRGSQSATVTTATSSVVRIVISKRSKESRLRCAPAVPHKQQRDEIQSPYVHRSVLSLRCHRTAKPSSVDPRREHNRQRWELPAYHVISRVRGMLASRKVFSEGLRMPRPSQFRAWHARMTDKMRSGSLESHAKKATKSSLKPHGRERIAERKNGRRRVEGGNSPNLAAIP